MYQMVPIEEKEYIGGELPHQVNLRITELARELHASRIPITVPRDNTESGQPLELTIQEVLLPLMGNSTPSSTAYLIDADAVLGGTMWTDLTDGGDSSLHHHDAHNDPRYVNVTGDTMTGELNMAADILMSSGSYKLKWAATRYIDGTLGLSLHDPALLLFYSPVTEFIGTGLTDTLQITLRKVFDGISGYIWVVGQNNQVLTGTAAGDLVLQGLSGTTWIAGGDGIFRINAAGAQIGHTDYHVDYTLQFIATDNTGVLTWMETEDYFKFSDDLLMDAAEKVQFRQTSESLSSQAAGYIDYAAATAHRFDTLIDLVATTATAGQITQAGTRLLHTYGTNNLFGGLGAGNLAMTGDENVGWGPGCLDALTSGYDNTGGGFGALSLLTTGYRNTAYGNQALGLSTSFYNTGVGVFAGLQLTQQQNTAVGALTLFSSTSTRYATALGYSAGYSNVTGDGGLYLGQTAGYYELASNKLFIDNSARASEADGRVKALQYGIFAAATADQYLTINGHLYAREDSLMIGTAKWTFRDPEINISSKADSYLDIVADGCVRINTNAWFEADGTRVASGAATTFNDLFIGFASARVPAANAPNWESFIGNLNAYTFAVNDFLELDAVELEHTYKEDSNFYFHVHWTTNGTEGAAKYVKWEIEYTIANADESGGVGGTFPATTVVSAETEIPASTADLANMYTAVASITGTNFDIGAILKIRVRRIASAGTAPVADPFGLMVGVHIEQDTDGSRSQVAK